MTQARGCIQRFKSDLLRNYLWNLIGFICNTIIVSSINTSHSSSTHDIRHENDNYGTPVQLLRAQTEAVAYKPTLARLSAKNPRYGIRTGRCKGCVSHHQELSTSPSYCCCCEPEFDPAPLLIESRHDALDSPSTPCIRVPSPLAWDRNNVRELRAQRRHVLGDGGGGSILTASPFSYSSTIGVVTVYRLPIRLPASQR